MKKDEYISSEEIIELGEKAAHVLAKTFSRALRNISKIIDKKDKTYETK